MPAIKKDVQEYCSFKTIAASATDSLGILNCDGVETASCTVRLTYNASAASGATLQLLYSPTGELDAYDTVVYASYLIDVTADTTVQETKILDLPKKGYMQLRIANADAVTITNVRVWTTVRRDGEIFHTADKAIYLLEEIKRHLYNLNGRLEAIDKLGGK